MTSGVSESSTSTCSKPALCLPTLHQPILLMENRGSGRSQLWAVPRLGSGRAGTQTRSVSRVLSHLYRLPRWSGSRWTHSVCRAGSSAPPGFSFPGPVQSAVPLLRLSDQGCLELQGEMGTEGRPGFSLCPFLTFLIPAFAKLGIPCLRAWGPHRALRRSEMVVTALFGQLFLSGVLL